MLSTKLSRISRVTEDLYFSGVKDARSSRKYLFSAIGILVRSLASECLHRNSRDVFL